VAATAAPAALAERVARAAAASPLADCSPAQRAELDELLAEASCLEDLPGKWQAAIVAAEQGAAPRGGCCCDGY
jgi:hypothetical protein